MGGAEERISQEHSRGPPPPGPAPRPAPPSLLDDLEEGKRPKHGLDVHLGLLLGLARGGSRGSSPPPHSLNSIGQGVVCFQSMGPSVAISHGQE